MVSSLSPVGGRRVPERSKSDHKKKGFIGRTLSFGRGSSSRRHGNDHDHHDVDDGVTNIFGSDIVSEDFFLTRLKDVKHDKSIVKLEIEDFITSCHHSLLPVVKAMMSANDDRAWEFVRFIDSIPSSEFMWWQGLKHTVMRDYEKSIPQMKEILTFEAKLVAMKGTPSNTLRKLFQTFQQDEDIQCVSFAGALFGYTAQSIPEKLADLLERSADGDNFLLEQEIVIHVICGWEQSTNRLDWKIVCDACLDVLQTGKSPSPQLLQSADTTQATRESHLRRPGVQRCSTAPAQKRPMRNSNDEGAPARVPPARTPSGRERRLPSRTSSSRQAPLTRNAPPRMPSRRVRRDGEVSSDKPMIQPVRRMRDASTRMDESSTITSSTRRSGIGDGAAARMAALSGRRTPARAKSLNLPSRAASAADRLAMLGANGSNIARSTLSGGRATPQRSSSRSVSRTASGRRNARVSVRSGDEPPKMARRAPASPPDSPSGSHRQEDGDGSNGNTHIARSEELNLNGDNSTKASSPKTITKIKLQRSKSASSAAMPRRSRSPDYNWAAHDDEEKA